MTQGEKTPEGETETGQADVPSDPPPVAPAASPEAGQAQDAAELNQPPQGGESVAENVPSAALQEGDRASPPLPENRPPVEQPVPDAAGHIGNVAVAGPAADAIEELSSPGSAPSKDEVVVEVDEWTVKRFFQNRLEMALAQFKKAILWNILSLVIIVLLVLFQRFVEGYDDAFYSGIVTTTVCLLCTFLFKRGCLHKTLSDMCKEKESFRKFWPTWCLLSHEDDIKAASKPSLRVPPAATAAVNTTFQHEGMDMTCGSLEN